MIRAHVLCCGGTGCTSSGSQKIQEIFQQEIERQGLAEEVKVVQTGCFGLCALGPVVIIYPDGTFYSHVTPDDVVEIVDEHLLKGRMVERLVYNEKSASAEHKEDEHAALNDTVFYKSQLRVALRNCGVINPENIEEYIGMDGYAALGKALTEMTPDEVIQTVLDSGLRGRGGAGFPTGLKWRFASGNRGNVQKYVCCNADEGDPGAFMDRSILEGDPHAVIEAMEIAGYAIGADQGYVYVRAEYPIAVKRLQIAIDQAKEYGLLGENIFGTGFNFNLEIRLGAGAFVCGEETALMTSIEGKRGEPRPRPPFPAVKGLFGQPHYSEQRRDLRQRGADHTQGRRLVRVPWVPKNPREPKCSHWAARFATRALSRFPWVPPCAISLRKSAAVSRTVRNSRRRRPADLQADAFPLTSLIRRSTMTT